MSETTIGRGRHLDPFLFEGRAVDFLFLLSDEFEGFLVGRLKRGGLEGSEKKSYSAHKRLPPRPEESTPARLTPATPANGGHKTPSP
jgi:hypothetical protein